MARMSFAPNPFHHQGPIRDHELFFGREADVRKVLSRLRRGQSVSVVGEEKIGKTSFLHHISNPQVAAQHGLTSQTHLFFYVPCKRLAVLDESECFRQIRAIVEKTVSTCETRSVLTFENVTSSDAYYWLNQAFSLFERAGIQPIVQLDDFGFLTANTRLSLVFFGNLRALVDVYDTLAYLTTSRVRLADLERKAPRIAGSPFFNIFREYELQAFSPGTTRRFLVSRLESVGAVFPNVVVEFISDLSRGEPYRLQLGGACAYDVWFENRGSLCDRHCPEVEKRFYDALRLTLGNSK
jgi:hypothetical protein